jgi:H+/Na+-translocating ferredoxin:NAD+ oxidoreductase subunit G
MATPADKAQRFTLAQTLRLAALAALLTAALAGLARCTAGRIAHNEQAWMQQQLDALIPAASHDNDVLADSIDIDAPELAKNGRPVRIYRARRAGRPVAAAIRAVAPDGYRGPIELLVVVAYDGKLVGVQVLRHDETPGLGDAFERREPGWLPSFRGHSLSDPPPARWSVRRDGGDFDAFTGATITPRAIVKAVRRTLEFHQRNRDQIYGGQRG